MQQITNQHELPDPVVEAVKRNNDPRRRERQYRHVPFDEYKHSQSVTGLLRPPLMSALEREHGGAVLDVSDGFFAIFGSIVHELLAAYDHNEFAKTEWPAYRSLDAERLVYGTSDLIIGVRPDRIDDYKITTVWDWMKGPKDEHVAQLNMLNWLNYGSELTMLSIVYLFRDWHKREIERKPDYPPAPVMRRIVSTWPLDVSEQFIDSRFTDHTAAVPRGCSPEERWVQPGHIRIQKKGRQKALRLLDNESQARHWLALKGHMTSPRDELPKDISLVRVPNRYRRCELGADGRSYCPVSHVCPLMKES